MDSSFAETIPNATIDTSMSEPQVGSHLLTSWFMTHKIWVILVPNQKKFEFQDIDQLQNHGINAADLNKAGFHVLWLGRILTNRIIGIFNENFQAKSCWHFDNKRSENDYEEKT